MCVGVADHAAPGPVVASQLLLLSHMLRSQEVPCTALQEDIQLAPETLVDDLQEEPMEIVLYLRLGKVAAAVTVQSQCACLCLRKPTAICAGVTFKKNEVRTHSTK